MKKIAIAVVLSVFMIITDASAQFFGFGRKTTPKEEVIEEKVETDVQEVQPEDKTKAIEEQRSIPVKLSDEEIEQIDDNLRNELRDTVKKDELNARVEYLEADNYIDRVERRRKLLRHGEDFASSSRAASTMKKANVNPKDNSQMNNYIFDRAGVGEKK